MRVALSGAGEDGVLGADSRAVLARPGPLEIATGVLYGLVPGPSCGGVRARPRAALEAAIRPFLARAPCVVAFSGGRDSSALLAVAVRLARREGWPEPIAVTLEFEAAPATREREWQERVLDLLDLGNWRRVRIGDALDLVGPVAARGLRRHGVLYPPNVHTIVPLAEQARGGAVLTGVGGDDVFGNWPWHDVGGLLAGRRPARIRDVRRLAHVVAPRSVRSEVLLRREPLLLPWIREPLRRRVGLRLAAEFSSAPRSWSARMRWTARWRAWRATVAAMQLLGTEHGATVGCPFMDPAFLGALAGAGGRCGWGDRTETMQALFSDVLPEQIIRRRGKAEFSGAFFGPHARRFAREWNGCDGLPVTLIADDALRAAWCAERPHFLSGMALQAAWLAGASG